MMKSHEKLAGAFLSLSLLLGLALVGAAGCSDDADSDSTPDLFTPAPGSGETAPLKLYSVPEAPMPKSGATLFAVSVKLNLESLGKEADFTRNEIVGCLVTVSHEGENMVSDTPLVDQQDADACRAGDKPDDLGVFLVGTPKKSGTMTFAIKMVNFEDKFTVQGSVSVPVQPGAKVPVDLIATPVP